MRRRDLVEDWQLKQRDLAKTLEDDCAASAGWRPATVPGVVQGDLLAQGVIPDPFQELNETAVQWVGERDWIYRCRFSWTPDEADGGEPVLCFGGLDTIATVWLNGQQLLASDNMFVAHRIPVQAYLTAGENELIILFESALRVGKEREAAHQKMPLWNGDSSRVYVRKAQYQYSWDWGPCLLTSGPWQPVWLEHTTARIAELYAPAAVSDDLQHAEFAVRVTVEHPEKLPSGTLQLNLYAPDGALLAEQTFSALEETLQHTFTVEQPQLWWPHGYGAQARYRLVATLRQDDVIVEQQEQLLGLRRLQLLQEAVEGEEGKSFRFDVNNTPIFCGGANWIPADLILNRVSAERYRTLLQQAVDAHMLTIRVWGGGIYESDTFYDLCDELGLLVWQDFLFACALYPAHEEFQQSVRAEAETAVRRLRHHPSIALWSGNNEDYLIARSLKRPISGPITDEFPARAIYEQLLPEVCARLDPARPYWRGSPYGGADDSNDRSEGDQHIWDIWHGEQAPYQDYPRFVGRFVSEFGMAALPSATTLAAMASPAERYPGSRVLDFHFKADGGVRRVGTYLSENLRIPAEMALYTYATQVLQSEALASAYRGWRRQFQGPGHYACSGALVWQLNDCWPCISWAIVDDALIPKMAYYAVRRALAPIALELGHDTATTSAVWAANSSADEIHGIVQVRRWSLDGQVEVEEEHSVTLKPHQTTPLGSVGLTVDPTHILQAQLLVDGVVQARAALWPEPLKYLTLPNPEIAVEHLADGEVRLLAKAPAKAVWLEGEEHVDWSDNGFDLFPDEPYTISATNLSGQSLSVRSLFDLQAMQ